MLEQLVKADARDIEARLLLATLFRRTGRLEEARAALDKLSRSQGAEKWELEIQREQALIDRTPAIEPPAPANEVSAADDEPTTTSRAA